MPLNEDALIARYFAPLAGPEGLRLEDDAARLQPTPGQNLVLTKDMLVAGVHFFPQDPPGAIARKALRVNLSDLAAKGAVPRGFLLGLALPADTTEAWLSAFAGGLAADAATFACPVLGGDTVATPGPLTISITALGETPAMVPRGGAQVGDLIYISGTIGGAALGLPLRRHQLGLDAPPPDWVAQLGADHAGALVERYLLPQPRLALRAALRHARAAMDVSDGFVGDLSKMLHLARATARLDRSGLPFSPAAEAAFALAPELIRQALTGGDDYEVLATVAPDEAAAFEDAARIAGVRVTRVGLVEAGTEPVTVLDARGVALVLGPGAYQHAIGG